MAHSRRKSTSPSREMACSVARVMLAAVVISRITPWRRRSSGTYAIPIFTACAGESIAARRPCSQISPPSAGVSPNNTRASSVRPAPTRPANPTISPARMLSPISCTPLFLQERPRTSSTTLPGATGTLGNTADSSRPTIMRINSPRETSSIRRVPTKIPSRSAVTRSATSGSSSSRWEI